MGVDSPKNQTVQDMGSLVGSWTDDTSDEISVGTRKLEEAIEKLVVISCPYTIGSVYMVEWRFSSHQLVMKSLLMGSVYNLCRV
jgi:hypothetical protein